MATTGGVYRMNPVKEKQILLEVKNLKQTRQHHHSINLQHFHRVSISIIRRYHSNLTVFTQLYHSNITDLNKNYYLLVISMFINQFNSILKTYSRRTHSYPTDIVLLK